jgi:hypothetical protein
MLVAGALQIFKVFEPICVQLYERELGTWDESFKPADMISLDDMFPKTSKV